MNLPVLAWTVVSAIGALLAVVGAREAWHDLRALRGYQNGRRLNARRDLRNQATRFVAFVAWTVTGALAYFGLLPPGVGVNVLVAVNVAFAVLAALDLRDRRRLLAGIR